MRTVYFDTAFWSYLARAGEAEFGQACTELRQLDARPVLTLELLEELMRNDAFSVSDRTLAARLGALPVAPLDLSFADWARNLADPQIDRTKSMELLRQTEEVWTRKAAELLNPASGLDPAAKRTFAQRTGLDEVSDAELEVASRRQIAARLVTVLRELGQEFPPPPRSNNDEEWGAWVSGARARLPESSREGGRRYAARVESLDGAFAALLRGVAGARKVDALVVGEAGPKKAREWRASIWDARHMAVFAVFQDQIDCMQVDAAQLRRIRQDEKHAMRQWGLDERCFAGAGSLSGILGNLAVLVAGSQNSVG